MPLPGCLKGKAHRERPRLPCFLMGRVAVNSTPEERARKNQNVPDRAVIIGPLSWQRSASWVPGGASIVILTSQSENEASSVLLDDGRPVG